MSLYKVKTRNSAYNLEAENSNQLRKEILKIEGISYEKIEENIYWQRNPRYKGMKLGYSNLSLQNYGCFVFSLAYMKGEDPKDVNELLAEKGGLTKSGLVISQKAAEILGLKLLKGDDKYIPGKMNNINYMPDWSPTIKEVKLGKSQHFVVRLIDKDNPLAGKNGTFIFDPWEGRELSINYYSFKSYRLFKK